MRILLIEGDSATAQSIEQMLKWEKFDVTRTGLGNEGVDLGKVYDFDLLLLDIELPDMSGFEVVRSLRAAKVKTPILILSGFVGVGDKVKGLTLGADDYMTKPFDMDELLARIHALVRRSRGQVSSLIKVGDLVVNLDRKEVEVNGVKVTLTGREYLILELICLRRGAPVMKEAMLDHLFGGGDEAGLKIIDVLVHKLLSKLAKASEGRVYISYIESPWACGYFL